MKTTGTICVIERVLEKGPSPYPLTFYYRIESDFVEILKYSPSTLCICTSFFSPDVSIKMCRLFKYFVSCIRREYLYVLDLGHPNTGVLSYINTHTL